MAHIKTSTPLQDKENSLKFLMSPLIKRNSLMFPDVSADLCAKFEHFSLTNDVNYGLMANSSAASQPFGSQRTNIYTIRHGCVVEDWEEFQRKNKISKTFITPQAKKIYENLLGRRALSGAKSKVITHKNKRLRI